MADTLDFKKKDKPLYSASTKVAKILDVPELLYLTVHGRGNPNSSEDFQNAVSALFSVSYGLRMSPKKDRAPKGYFPYVVCPLEGHWSLPADTDPAAPLDKDKLIWTLMIRQPDFASASFIEMMKEEVFAKEGNPLVPSLGLEKQTDGLCCQMMHLGSYDDEPESFENMIHFCHQEGYQRIGKEHKEIYLSDFRKTAPEKLKTLLRFPVKKVAGS